MRKGRKSLAQTKAPIKDRIKGSKINEKGSAASKSSASSIVLSNEIIDALSKKAKEFNTENKQNKVSLSTLKAVFRRGAGAFSTSHRPNMTRNGWAYARVNKFLDKKSGKAVKKAYVQDDDLMEKGGELHIKDNGLLKSIYPEAKQLFAKHGLILNTDYAFTDGSNKSYLPHIGMQKTDEKVDKIAVTYYEDAYEVLGEFVVEIEDNGAIELELEFPNWGIDEELEIYENGGLIAPNGKQSNLTPEQYKLVRTPEFKAWFGDWDNDPEKASKVVDENGEPMVVYHGSNKTFNEFDINKSKYGFFFTNSYDLALTYDKNVNSFFLNINKPRKKDFKGANYDGDYQLKDYSIRNIGYDTKTFASISRPNSGYDGAIMKNVMDIGQGGWNENLKPSNIYVVFDSKQIKLADGTNNTFDMNNPDIRFEKGGEMKNIVEQIGELVAPFQKKLAEERIARLIQEGEKLSNWAKELIYLGLVYDLYSAIGNYLSDSDKLIGEIKFEEGYGGSIEISAIVERDGQEYKFRTEMIIAGGYNIQRRHYRYIVHTGLKYHQGNSEAETVQKEIKELKEKIKFENKIEEYKKDIEFYNNTIEKYKVEIAHNKQFTDEQIWEMLKEQKDYRTESYNLTWEEMVRREAPVVQMTKSKEGYEAYKYENYYLDGIKSWKESNIGHLEGRIRSYTAEIKKIEKRIQKAQGLEQGGELEDLHEKMKDDLLQDAFKSHKSIEQIAEEKDVELDYAQEQLRKGMQTESEHSDDPMVQEIIALQHLDEMIDYYQKLEYIEGNIMENGGIVVDSTDKLVELVRNERESKIREWYKLGYKVVVARNDGYAFIKESERDSEFIESRNPSRKKIIDIIKNNPNLKNINFNGTIKVGNKVGEELEIADDFSVVLWQNNINYEKGGQIDPDNTKTKDMITHKAGSAGGLLVGNRHSEGGIKAVNKSTNTPLEMEGGEVVITRNAVSDEEKREFEGKMLTNREILSKINESGGGVSFEDGGEVDYSVDCDDSMAEGGKIKGSKEILEILDEAEWQLINGRSEGYVWDYIFKSLPKSIVGREKRMEFADKLYNIVAQRTGDTPISMAKGGSLKKFDPKSVVGKMLVGKIRFSEIVDVKDMGNGNIWVTHESFSGFTSEENFTKDELFAMSNGKEVRGEVIRDKKVKSKMADGGELDTHSELKQFFQEQNTTVIVEEQVVEEIMVEVIETPSEIMLFKEELTTDEDAPMIYVGSSIYANNSNGTDEWVVKSFTQDGINLIHVPSSPLAHKHDEKHLSFEELRTLFNNKSISIKFVLNERELNLILMILKDKLQKTASFKEGGLVFVDKEGKNDEEIMESQFGNKQF
jgi:hypothetical protein